MNAFQRKFVNEVRRCDEMERKLRYLEREIRKDGIPVLDTGENPEAPMPREMIDLEVRILGKELRVEYWGQVLQLEFPVWEFFVWDFWRLLRYHVLLKGKAENILIYFKSLKACVSVPS